MNATTAAREHSLHSRTIADLAWPLSLSLVLLLAIVAGGSSQAASGMFIAFRLACIALLAVALFRLLHTEISTTERLALMIVAAGVTLVCVQLAPLPYAMFSDLPGRGFITKVMAIAGIEPSALPMTLSPADTRASLLTLLPPIAVFIATLVSSGRSRWLLAGVILLGSIANVMLGLAQRFDGVDSSLYLYEITNRGSATGFFSNRNNFAMLLCVSIPLTWALAHKLHRMRALSAPAAIGGGMVMMLVTLMGLAASNSRSGILLGMLALTLSTLMVLSTPETRTRSARRQRRGKLAMLAILGGAFVIGQFGMTGILRIVESDPLADHRSEMREVTLRAAADYFPLGSGFGTFRQVYEMHETHATMINTFVNHAHNDWLELWLEGGLPAAAVMAAFAALFCIQAVRVWNPRGAYAEHLLPRAASIAALVLLLHSLVEFPLRMPALACIFAAMIAILMAPAPHRGGSRRQHHASNTDERRPSPRAAAVVTAPPMFRVRRSAAEHAPDHS